MGRPRCELRSAVDRRPGDVIPEFVRELKSSVSARPCCELVPRAQLRLHELGVSHPSVGSCVKVLDMHGFEDRLFELSLYRRRTRPDSLLRCYAMVAYYLAPLVVSMSKTNKGNFYVSLPRNLTSCL